MPDNTPDAPPQPTPPAAPKKVSWFKRLCHAIGKVLNVIVTDEQKIQPVIVPALEAAFPALAVPIAAGAELATKIAKQILVTETVGAAVAGAPTSNAALGAAVAGIGPEIDAWVQNVFPGAAELSAASKAGLVQAFYNALKEIDPGAFPASAVAGVAAQPQP